MKFQAGTSDIWSFLKKMTWLVECFVMETNKIAILYKVS